MDKFGEYVMLPTLVFAFACLLLFKTCDGMNDIREKNQELNLKNCEHGKYK